MLINAFYEKGKIILPENITIKKERIPVVVEIPDEEVNAGMEIKSSYKVKSPALKKKLARLNSIRHYNTSYLADDIDDKELLLEGIKMKYGYKD